MCICILYIRYIHVYTHINTYMYITSKENLNFKILLALTISTRNCLVVPILQGENSITGEKQLAVIWSKVGCFWPASPPSNNLAG